MQYCSVSIQELNGYDLHALFNKKYDCTVISFYLRSGSYLLHSLLDGHSKLLCLPPWASLIYREPNLVQSVDAYLVGQASREFAGFMRMLMQPAKLWEKHNAGSTVHCFVGERADVHIDTPMQAFEDLLIFFQHFLQKNNLVSRRNYLLGIAFAYTLAQGTSLNELIHKSAVLYQMHAPIHAFLPTIAEDFSTVYFVQTVRNPVQALASYIQEYELYAPENIPHLFEWLFAHGTMPTSLPKEQCVAVKHESVHRLGKAYLQRLLHKIGLPWENICEKSTLNGQTFWWTKKGKIFTGLNANLQDDFCHTDKSFFDCHDKILLTHFLQTRYDMWKYRPCHAAHFLPLLRQAKKTMLEIHRENPQYDALLQEYFRHSGVDILTVHLLLSMHFFAQAPVYKELTEKIISACVNGIAHSKKGLAFMPILDEEGIEHTWQKFHCTW